MGQYGHNHAPYLRRAILIVTLYVDANTKFNTLTYTYLSIAMMVYRVVMNVGRM